MAPARQLQDHPDRASLEVAHRMLRTPTPLDELLRHPAFELMLNTLARRHMKRRDQGNLNKLHGRDYMIDSTHDRRRLHGVRARLDWEEIEDLGELRSLVTNNSYAASFQNMGQYRSALTRHLDSLLIRLPARRLNVTSWRARIGKAADWPLHSPTDVERAMVAEIAELRAALAGAMKASSGAQP